jgi:cell division protein ZapB
MDLIEQLEGRIDATLEELAALREENRRLREEADHGKTALEEENRTLREELEEERATKQAVLDRIDSLLKKLKVESDDS